MIDPLGLGVDSWPSMAWQIAWQSTAVLSFGLIASRVVAMRPSRAHRILLASAIACLLVPPANLAARRLDMGLLPARTRTMMAGPARSSTATFGPATAQPPRLASDAPPLDAARRPLATAEAGPAAPAPPASARGPARPRRDLPIGAAIGIVWAILTTAGFVRLLASIAGGLKLKAGSTALDEPELVAWAESASRSLGLTTTPELRVSSRVRCPVVWCWGRRPLLILPATADTGPDTRGGWSPVLCHELAHWKRGDHLAGLAGELVTCVLPWQPLARVLRTRMADLSELACDDWALSLTGTVTPQDYAEVLLGLAAERRRPLVPAAVSRRSGLAGRLRHILEDSKPMPRAGKLWSTLVAVLSLALVAALALARTRQAEATALEPPAAKDAGEKSTDAKPSTVEGTVRGPGREPLRGAEVLWVGADLPPITHVALPRDHPEYNRRRMKVLARGATDDRGHFALEARVERPSVNEPWTMVVVHKAGLAPSSALVALDGKPLEVLLEPPVPIIGRLLGPGGDPAAGVRVQLDDYSNGQWRDRSKLLLMSFGVDQVWDSRPVFFPNEFRTDEAGRFVIDGFVPANVFASLLLSHPDHAVEELTVSTGASTEPTPAMAGFSIRPLAREFTHTLAPARPVTGRITDAESNKPLAGMTVEVTPMRRHGGKPIRTRTDADGRYRVADRDAERFWVAAYPAAGSGYIPANRGMIPWPTGSAELRVDLALRRGVVIRGRVIDEEAAKPIPGAGIAYQPKRGNPNLRGGNEARSPVLTDADGRFVLTGVRGAGVVVAEAPSDAYGRRAVDPVDFGYNSSLHVHGLARLEVPAEGDAPEVVITLRKGFTLEARAVRPDGTAVGSVRAWCPELTSRLLENWVSPTEFADGLFRLPGAEPGRTYRVFFLEPDETFAAVAELKAEPGRKTPIAVKLAPTATLRGRVLDVDGKPLEGAQILPYIELVDKGGELSEQALFDRFRSHVYNQFTNEPLKQSYPAKFVYKGLIPGVRYFVSWNSRQGRRAWHVVEALGPGEVRDLGDIRDGKKGGKDGN